MKITGDYGFYEHSKFITKNKTEFDKFEKHLNEYKELMKDEPKAIKEFEKQLEEYCQKRLLKEMNF
jgi:hypothetical protein